MAQLIAILLAGLVCEAIGVVFLSKGLRQLGAVGPLNPGEILRLDRAGATNGNLLIGIALEAAFFSTLLILLTRTDVSFIWPLTALGFVLTTAAARFVLHEQVSGLRWLGVVLIVTGAALITWTENSKTVPSSTEKPPSIAR